MCEEKVHDKKKESCMLGIALHWWFMNDRPRDAERGKSCGTKAAERTWWEAWQDLFFCASKQKIKHFYS